MDTFYIETSIISHATAWPSKIPAITVLQDHAKEWLASDAPKFRLVASSAFSRDWLARTPSGKILRTQPKLEDYKLTTAKETMVDIISRQPDDSSYDALLRELAYARMIQRGLQDAEEGRIANDSDAKIRIDSWQK